MTGGKTERFSFLCVLVVVVQLLSCVQLLATPWMAACQAPLSYIISQSLLKFMSIELVISSNHLILCYPHSCAQSFPASRSFPMSQLFASGGQHIGASASASVLPVNIQGWCPLWLTGLILQSKGLESSPGQQFKRTTIKSSALSLPYGPTQPFKINLDSIYTSDSTYVSI